MKQRQAVRPVKIVWDLLRDLPGAKPHAFGDRYFLSSFFPPFPSEAFHRFCETALTGRRSPGTTYLAVTPKCPASCEHCSYGGRSQDALSGEFMLDLVRQVKELGGHTLGFTGGEPMLRDDLEELVAAANPEMATLVFTTGWGLTEDRARRLRDAGLTCVTVGVDAADPKLHDQVRRREGSFEEARAGVRAAQAAEIYTAISCVASRERIADGELDRLFDLACEWGVGELRINSPIATGAMAGKPEQMLSEAELEHLTEFTNQHNAQPDTPVVTCLSVLESSELFGCGAGHHHLFIDAGGNVCPCDLTPMSFGNCTEKPLTEIWESMGEYFGAPRNECIMRSCANQLKVGQELPLAPEETHEQCPRRCSSEPLPEIYRRLAEAREKYGLDTPTS